MMLYRKLKKLCQKSHQEHKSLYQSDAHRGEDHPENIFDLVVVLDKNNVSDEDEDAIFTPLENIEDRSNCTMAILPRIYSKSQWNYYRAVSPLYYETIMNKRGGKFICQ
jgi:hypothetical protein